MFLSTWRQSIRRAAATSRDRGRQRARNPLGKPLLELLESRLAPATLTVTSPADDLTPNDGSVSLREAISAVNAGNNLGDPDIIAQNPGTFGTNDTINFNIAAAGIQTINVGATGNGALPALTKPVVINGYSQTGSSQNTLANGDNALILIELNGASAGANANGLEISGGGSMVQGLAINRFSANGILLDTTGGDTVQGNFAGTNPQGTAAAPNGVDGIRILSTSNNIIGGTTPAARNVASGNTIDGIHIFGTLAAPATANLIEGNFSGVNAAGTGSVGNRTGPPAPGTAEGNSFFGIEISGGNNNTVGGTTAGARNVAGLNGAGIEVDDGGQNNVIQGNFSGVGADGTTPVGNLLHGIVLRSSNGFGPPLGPAQPNEPGVQNNLVGGTVAGAGNLVEFNGTGGVAVFGNPVSASGQPNTGNAILGNSIFQNGRSNPSFLLGIDLTNSFPFPKDDGITPNDSKGHGAANDPNNFTNFPVLTSASPAAAGGTTIVGTYTQSVSPSTTFRLEFFSNTQASGTGNGEGQTFLGFTNVTTDGSGNASFTVTVPTTVPVGQFVSATATDPANNTSEFAKDVTVFFATPQNFVVTTTADSGPGSLRQAILNSNTSPGVLDTISFNIPGTGVQTITPASALPTITDPVIIDGYTQPTASANTLANGDNAKILIELSGASAGAGVNGLTLTAGGSTVRGLAINRFSGDGILVTGAGANVITGNFVGTIPAGTAAQPNGIDGIRIEGSSGNTVGGVTPDARNLASGNTIDGIHVFGTLTAPATANLIEGNFSGVNAAGTGSVGNRTGPPAPGTAEGNSFFGIEISGGNNNTVGGTTAGARNVAGFNGAGIEVDDGGQNNVIQGNFSGVGADGTTPVGNLLHGIVLRSSNGFMPPLGPAQPNEPGVQNNLVGGTVAGAGNLVEFNGTGGVAVFGNPVSASGQPNVGNAILGNSIFMNGRSNPSFLLGIDLTNQFPFPKDDGNTPNDSQGHGAANDPNNFTNFPVLTSAAPAAAGGTTIVGTYTQAVSPNTTFRIEFFSNTAASGTGFGEGQTFLGFTNVTTDATGKASFTVTVPTTVPVGQFVSATATDPANNTSEFAKDVTVFFATPQNFVVTTTADSGPGSLRQAILNSNASPGVLDTISFNIPGTGVQTITPASALPTITDPVIIDGYTQPTASANTLANGDNAKILIELSGASAGAGVNGLTLTAGGSTVRGLAINRFSGDGILVTGAGANVITGNFVGTIPAGTAAAPNGIDGIRVEGSSGNTVGGVTPDARNLTSGNTIDGIHVFGTLTAPATANLIEGNFSGVNASGTGSVGNRTGPPAPGTAEGNSFFGIEISGGNNNTVGGTTAGARNVAGFNGAGIEVDDGGQNNVIQGNFSGVGADGTTPVGNLLHGIVLRSSNGFMPPLGPAQPNEPGVQNNLVGGTVAGAGNLVEFNGTGGVAVFGNPVSASGQPNTGNAILGNSIFQNGRSNPSFLLGIDLTNQFPFPKDDGITPNDSQGHGAPNDPNNFTNFPVLTSASPAAAGGTTISGTYTQAVSPNTTFRIEFFSNTQASGTGNGEGQTFLGFTNVTTDATGKATINFTVPTTVPVGQFVSATATDPANNTSEFAKDVTVFFATPQNFVVTTTADSGPGSLRQAILNSNTSPGVLDTISFNIPGTGVQTITPASALPTITDPVIIDGYTQPTASANTLANGDNAKILIELSGASAGAGVNGLTLTAGGSTVRGLAINRFSGDGILVTGAGANVITGNFVGTIPAGTAAAPNGIDGIRVEGSSGNTVGGVTPDARNLASGNTIDGIHIFGTLTAPATANLIEGNFSGVNAAGTGSVGNRTGPPAPGTAEGNSFFGIEISGGNNNTVGGTTAGARNVAGFNGAGIEVDDGGQNNVIQGNFSGVGADGTTPVGNLLHGIVLRSSNGFMPPLGPAQPNEPGVQNNLVGGTVAGAGNLVEFNGTGGVAVFGNPVSASGQPNTGNAILGNSIFMNGRSNPSFLLGIDLTNQFPFPKDDGNTPNDSQGHGAANDPNNFTDFPVLTSAAPASGGTTISGTLTQAASPNTMFRIEFFANTAASGTGFGEGQTFLGFTNVTTDAMGKASFTTTVTTAVPGGEFISATATDAANNTSEFSKDVTVAFGVPTITSISPTFIVEGSGATTVTVNGTNFSTGSTVQLGGTALSTVFGTSTQLSAIIPATALADEATLNLTVFTPAPGGGTSNVQTLPVVESLLPDGTRGTANQRFVSEVFHDLLGRQVDPLGLANWSGLLDQGVSRTDVVAAIETSPEYRSDQVIQAFRTFLHRSVDPVGLNNSVAFLNSGGTLEQLDNVIVSSPEYFQTRAGGTNDGFLDALYNDVLHRPVDASGRMIFDQAFAGGATRAQVAAAIFGSPEYRQDLVQSYFGQFLDRAVDPSGLATFTSALQMGARDEAVIAAIMGSPEFFSKVQP